MSIAICGIDCDKCEIGNTCKGCAETNGRPFGGECIVAKYLEEGGAAFCEFKEKLIAAFNTLGIEDMETVTDLNALVGSYINLTYTLPGGQEVKLWDDNRVYLGNQLCKKDSERCYGLAADEHYLMVSEYGNQGADAEIVVFKRWN